MDRSFLVFRSSSVRFKGNSYRPLPPPRLDSCFHPQSISSTLFILVSSLSWNHHWDFLSFFPGAENECTLEIFWIWVSSLIVQQMVSDPSPTPQYLLLSPLRPATHVSKSTLLIQDYKMTCRTTDVTSYCMANKVLTLFSKIYMSGVSLLVITSTIYTVIGLN